MSTSYPIALKLEGRRCLVVGDGPEALERARALLRAGAIVRVVTGKNGPLGPVGELAAGDVAARELGDTDLDGVWLVVLAERDEALAERLRVATEARRIFYCAVDMPRFSSFSYLALARAGVVCAAIGTEGEAPALARRLREILEQAFQRSGLERFAEELAALRKRTPSERRRDVLGAAVAGVQLTGELLVPERVSDHE